MVICTGAKYASPWRDGDGEKIMSFEERNEECKTFRQKVLDANGILIIGGGPTGIEAAGYIAEKFPNKKVGIIEMAPKLVGPIKGAHEKVMPYLESLGVKIHLSTPFKGEESLRELGYDLSISCWG
jgi:apoptosis-inducing factor 2